jgi:hypothetical protein
MVCPKRLCLDCSALDGGDSAAHAKGQKTIEATLCPKKTT